MPDRARTFSEERYQHHHTKWVEAKSQGDRRRAARHLYALRAHLNKLDWLDPTYARLPRYGVVML